LCSKSEIEQLLFPYLLLQPIENLLLVVLAAVVCNENIALIFYVFNYNNAMLDSIINPVGRASQFP